MSNAYDELIKKENVAPPFHRMGIDIHGQRFVYSIHYRNGRENKGSLAIIRHRYNGANVGKISAAETVEIFQYNPGHEQYELPTDIIERIEKRYKEYYTDAWGVQDMRNMAYKKNVIMNEFIRVVVLDMDDIIATIAHMYLPTEQPAELRDHVIFMNDTYKSYVNHSNGERLLLFSI